MTKARHIRKSAVNLSEEVRPITDISDRPGTKAAWREYARQLEARVAQLDGLLCECVECLPTFTPYPHETLKERLRDSVAPRFPRPSC